MTRILRLSLLRDAVGLARSTSLQPIVDTFKPKEPDPAHVRIGQRGPGGPEQQA